MKKLSILGSTGSIGTRTLDLVARHPQKFQVLALAAGRNLSRLAEQVRQFSPEIVSVQEEEDVASLKKLMGQNSAQVVFGPAGLAQVASLNVDVVVSAIVGAAGLEPTIAALRSGRNVALANKESMVIAGSLMQAEAKKSGASIVPIDSEHSAIFQVLGKNRMEDIKSLILTASGGPFFQKTDLDFEQVTPEEALKHPNWDMGPKITIDSATMMNKGLEMIEASFLFSLSIDKIDVVIHPKSIVHSLVEYVDASMIAQMGLPDMRVAIAYALTYPERVTTGVASLDLAQLKTLTFARPDARRFPALNLAKDAAEAGGSMPAVLNAANEIAVEKFLKRKISFAAIPRLVADVMEGHSVKALGSLEDVLEADRWARERAQNL